MPALAQEPQPPVSESPTLNRDRLDRVDAPIRPGAPPVAVPPAPVSVTAAPAQVALSEVRYEGATLDRGVLDGATRPFIGAALDRDTLQKLANAVSSAYAASDIAFYAVSIPAQAASGGVLVVRVVEGRIVDYRLARETRTTPRRLIDAHMRRLMRDMPTHKSTMERTLSLLRDVPGQTVQAQLRRTAKPDELVLDLDVSRKQVEVTLNVNNRGVFNVTTGAQAQVSVAVNGLLREGDSTRVSAYLPFQPYRYQFYSASHATPIGTNGTTLGLSGGYVRTRTRGFDILGEAKQLGVVLVHPVVRSYKRNLSLTASLDGADSENYYLDTAFGGFRTRALRLGANWSSIGKTSGYGVSLSLTQGLDALGARPIEGYSKAAFRKANLQATLVAELSSRIAAKATMRGQYSADLLPTTERFVLGGEGAGLAFRDGFLTADKAIAAGVEVSMRVLGAKSASRGLSVFAYVDGALAHSYARPLYGIPAGDQSLASAGGGVRVSPIAGWVATAQIATPVNNPFEGMSKKARFFFSVSRTL